MLNEANGFLEKRLRLAVFRLFGEMDEAAFAGVRSFFQWADLQGGEFVFRQGNEGRGMYILVSGRLKVLVQTEGRAEVVAEISPGETVGEMALITGEARTADVLAMRDCVLARLEKPDFEALIQKYPTALLNISRTIIQRLQKRNTLSRQKKVVTNVCLLPVSEEVDAAGFGQQLKLALEKFGQVRLLTSEEVDQSLQKPGIAWAGQQNQADYRAVTSWLEEQESSHRFVVYLPDDSDSEWTKRCIRQSDELVLLANPQEPPGHFWSEELYLHGDSALSLAVQTLVLLQKPDTTMPSGTAAWLAKRAVKFHHHVRLGVAADLERLARFLSGNAVGLVLSGGAARGIAHIGVFRALQEAGIPIDMVGGTSIGAVIGALISRGWDAEMLRRRTGNYFKSNPTSDFNLFPRVSIFKGKKLDRLLREVFGEIQIEDLWLNFYCVSCNLTKTNPIVHDAGSLARAIRASISIPGVFPPAELEKDLHVDGGVFNNMPVDVMSRLGVGYIVAVDLQSYRQRQDASEAEVAKRRMPNLLFVVMESSMLSGRFMSQEFEKEVDLYINPPLRAFGLLDWQKFDKIEETGYRHAKQVLEKATKKPLM